ncbi:hypothetical protein Slin15195_G042060 [Septoria linicola]|uniref:Uncharacterized protein n=1 Tax=Septoria linicola TaxID=215465 RepID=A0A9Q9AK58_9PEZI|nr:hypothetical protein Slin14017_G045570 [Septoria linicola]USW50887.1 hypothetical protein Slin15195_G042060 [Septoria linicola]
MPAKRGVAAARNLPARRLPVGTPLVAIDNFTRSTSRSTQRSSDFETSSDLFIDPKQYGTVTMPASLTGDFSDNAAALAQAKLRRQQERNQQAEAALYNPLPVEKPRRDQSRNKAKPVWRPLDFNDGFAQRSQCSEDIVEIHINKYPAPSRGTSLSRSMSSVSQQTTGASTFGPPDSDPAMNDDAGFQLWTRRGGQMAKPTGEASTYGEKPDVEKQKTVEATFDKNEILEVFKQELPSPDFLGTTPGISNGQVQFVQHPNGDVAAHMWSAENYAWDNIGHFSNIRKRTEGQLAGERLKGETAHQKLQQHTLAYFRILAKQREASTTGTPFGQDNIKAALPDPLPGVTARQPSNILTRDALKASSPTNTDDATAARVSTSMPSGTKQERVVITAKPEDPFSAGAHDYCGAFNWQSSFGQGGASAQTGHQPQAVPARRHESTADSTPTREALRDQLHKTVDIAMKRSLSQANIARTVLHDPMQTTDRDNDQRKVSPPVFHVNSLCPNWQDLQTRESRPVPIATNRKTSGLTIGSVPDVDFEPSPASKRIGSSRFRPVVPLQPTAKSAKKSYDEALRDWWTGGSKFARQEELFRAIMNSSSKTSRPSVSSSAGSTHLGAIDSERTTSATGSSSDYNETTTRIFIPIYENLASYVQGPPEQRRDYWSRWTQPPDWCIDRGPNGNNSFFDNSWGQPPARVGRDPRYRRDRGELQFGGLSPMASSAIGSPSGHPMSMGMSRFGFGRY